MMKLPIAYQLYSMRNEVERDFEGALRTVKSLGFDGVEFAGFFGYTAPQVRQMLDQVGLLAVSSHVPLAQIKANPEGVIAYHQALGCPYISVPYLDEHDRPGAPGFARVLALLTSFGQQCHEAGMTLLYHNHDFEFIKVSGQYGLDFLFQAVPEQYLATQIDTCWVKYAGVDPASYLLSYKGRAPLVHIKDFIDDNSGRTPYALIGLDDEAPDRSGFAYKPFGHGSQDPESLVQAAIDAGAKWLVLEQDEPDVSPLEDAKKSMETFARLGLK